MATVDKNFRIKNGLVVEGSVATVNGNDILTKNTQDGDAYIIGLIGGTATSENTANAVVKRDGNGDFAAGDITVNELSIKTTGRIYEDADDLIIENIDGNDVIVNGEDIRLNAQDDVRLTAGQGGDVFVRADSGQISLIGPSIYAGENLNYTEDEKVATQGYVDNAITNIDLTFNSDEISEGASNLYYTDSRAREAVSSGSGLDYNSDTGVFSADLANGLQIDGQGSIEIARNTVDTWYDANGAAAAAQTAAQSYADGLAPNYDANGAAAAAQTAAETNANFYTDNAIGNLGGSGTASVDGQIDVLTGTGIQVNGGNNSVEIDRQTVDTWYDAAGSASSAQQAAELYADNAVAALVGSAPAVLDTIQELATALENNPDIIADLENVAAGKQNTLTAGSNIDITEDTISVTGLDSADISDFNTAALSATSAAYDAAGAAAAAQTAAEGYADGLTDNMLDGTTPFSDININDVAKQVAARSTSLGSVPVVAYQFNKTNFKSGKFLVKIDNGTHNEISEILVTLDSSDNVAITEYAIVGTNGTRGTITANVVGTHCRIVVDPVNDSTITVSGTVFKA
jgi:hypothetical protein